MEEERSIRNLKNTMVWRGWKEIPWIIGFIFLLVATYGYYDLYTRHQELINKECVWNCMMSEATEKMREVDPTLHVVCDFQTRSCMISGVKDHTIPKLGEVGLINVSE